MNCLIKEWDTKDFRSLKTYKKLQIFKDRYESLDISTMNSQGTGPKY